MATRGTRCIAALLVSTVVLTTTAGCSLLPGSGDSDKPALERASLRIGVLPRIDVAPLYIAKRDKLWEAAGLEVEFVRLPDDKDGVRQLNSGTLDIAFASHVTLFRAASSGSDLQLQGEAYQAGSHTMALVAKPDSKYRNRPAEVPRPVIAVNALDDLGTLTTRSVLATSGTPSQNITFREMRFEEMADQLQAGRVDAAWMVEPFITKAEKEKSLGAVVVADTGTGATKDFPMSGYAANRKFTEENKRTMEAFRKVLSEAQLRGTNRLIVQEVLTQYAEVDFLTSALVSVGTYPVSINAVRLQRIVDMMETSGLLPNKLDLQKLLPPAPAISAG